jgi:arylsulfatase A-like enzyme
VVVEIDWSAGRILDVLDELGLSENTLVIWTNDNPASTRFKGASNLPLKGGGYGTTEGGMRVPFIARWPGKIPAGKTCDEVISLMDMMPTFAKLAGTEAPSDRIIDGHDIRPLLSGEAGAETPYEAFYYYYITQLQAVRAGPWKLVLPRNDRFKSFSMKPTAGQGELYHLIEDPTESENLFDEHPDIVKRLTALAEKARADIGDTKLPGKNRRPVGHVKKPVFQVMEKR